MTASLIHAFLSIAAIAPSSAKKAETFYPCQFLTPTPSLPSQISVKLIHCSMIISTLPPPSLGPKGGSHGITVYAQDSYPLKLLGHHKYPRILTSFDTSYCQGLPTPLGPLTDSLARSFTLASASFQASSTSNGPTPPFWGDLTACFVSCPSKEFLQILPHA